MDSENDTSSHLKFIGRVNPEEKINVPHMYVSGNSFFERLCRTFYDKDNRANTLVFVRNTIHRSFDIIERHIHSSNPFEISFCKNMIIDLGDAKNGIESLKTTYTTDIKFCCDMDTIIQQIDGRMTIFNEMLGNVSKPLEKKIGKTSTTK